MVRVRSQRYQLLGRQEAICTTIRHNGEAVCDSTLMRTADHTACFSAGGSISPKNLPQQCRNTDQKVPGNGSCGTWVLRYRIAPFFPRPDKGMVRTSIRSDFAHFELTRIPNRCYLRVRHIGRSSPPGSRATSLRAHVPSSFASSIQRVL